MNFRDILFLVAVAGGVLMAWAGWQEFQGEGGKFQLGSSAPAAASSAPAAAPTVSAAPVDPAPVERAAPAEETPDVEAAAVDEPDGPDAEDGRPIA